MALLNCPECNTEVASTAYDCPKCGAALRKPTRTFFGKIIKWAFIGFNFLMIAWLIAGLGISADNVRSATSDAQADGAAIVFAIRMGMILGLWVVGDIILGLFFLFTRPSKS